MKKKNDWIKKGTLIIVLLVCIASYLWVPEIHKTMNRIFKMFASGDFTVVRDFVASYGGYAALISFLLISSMNCTQYITQVFHVLMLHKTLLLPSVHLFLAVWNLIYFR